MMVAKEPIWTAKKSFSRRFAFNPARLSESRTTACFPPLTEANACLVHGVPTSQRMPYLRFSISYLTETASLEST